jgi:hypothetical protein
MREGPPRGRGGGEGTVFYLSEICQSYPQYILSKDDYLLLLTTQCLNYYSILGFP